MDLDVKILECSFSNDLRSFFVLLPMLLSFFVPAWYTVTPVFEASSSPKISYPDWYFTGYPPEAMTTQQAASFFHFISTSSSLSSITASKISIKSVSYTISLSLYNYIKL